MKLLKGELKTWEASTINKARVWSVAFAGCQRIHEILCKQKLHYVYVYVYVIHVYESSGPLYVRSRAKALNIYNNILVFSIPEH